MKLEEQAELQAAAADSDQRPVVPSSTSSPKLPACTTNSTPSSSPSTAASSSKLLCYIISVLWLGIGRSRRSSSDLVDLETAALLSSALLLSIHQLPQASSCFSAILNTIAHPAANPNDVADTGTATGLPHLLLAVEVDQVTISSAYAVRSDQPAVNSYSPTASATSARAARFLTQSSATAVQQPSYSSPHAAALMQQQTVAKHSNVGKL
ncbi:hypothetical protein TB1_045293 [Malus domestica]|uniref:Uncharacterized protein n=1 Tax=Malus domestica TaxID=3750 RepID=A0A498J583_MALDO|nr:hypothetical protein DVH24_032723 [Malus domestica]